VARRALALLVDAAVVAALVAAGRAGGDLIAALTGAEPVARSFRVAYLLVVPAAYFVVADAAGARTLGKWLAGARVVRADGGPVGAGRALGRLACLVALAAPLGLGLALSAAVALLSPDRRGLHDRLAGTRVVRTRLL
jgi:uncharacterized RDD family membrane protein YckC